MLPLQRVKAKTRTAGQAVLRGGVLHSLALEKIEKIMPLDDIALQTLGGRRDIKLLVIAMAHRALTIGRARILV